MGVTFNDNVVDRALRPKSNAWAAKVNEFLTTRKASIPGTVPVVLVVLCVLWPPEYPLEYPLFFYSVLSFVHHYGVWFKPVGSTNHAPTFEHTATHQFMFGDNPPSGHRELFRLDAQYYKGTKKPGRGVMSELFLLHVVPGVCLFDWNMFWATFWVKSIPFTFALAACIFVNRVLFPGIVLNDREKMALMGITGAFQEEMKWYCRINMFSVIALAFGAILSYDDEYVTFAADMSSRAATSFHDLAAFYYIAWALFLPMCLARIYAAVWPSAGLRLFYSKDEARFTTDKATYTLLEVANQWVSCSQASYYGSLLFMLAVTPTIIPLGLALCYLALFVFLWLDNRPDHDHDALAPFITTFDKSDWAAIVATVTALVKPNHFEALPTEAQDGAAGGASSSAGPSKAAAASASVAKWAGKSMSSMSSWFSKSSKGEVTPVLAQAKGMRTRVADLPDNTSAMTPIKGVRAAPLLTLRQAVEQSGLASAAADGYIASERGAELAKTDVHGLAADQIAALTLYTMQGDFYPTLNQLLHTKDRTSLKPYFPYLRLMLEARDKLPKYSGTVWRGVKGKDLRNEYPKGKELYWWAFSSTTKELSTLQTDQFLGTSGVRTVFNIQVENGVDIVKYSIYQDNESEAEVLMYPGTKLVVVDNMEMGGDLFMVHLKEVNVPVSLID